MYSDKLLSLLNTTKDEMKTKWNQRYYQLIHSQPFSIGISRVLYFSGEPQEDISLKIPIIIESLLAG